ncbi:mycothiol synthase [Nocardioides sp. GXQ0305]|uniref:mycothiol synthase n=1 Tax=Nocardioides sp. GXQ0305 TaxID=3423912 RepID=UPI003D7E107E
MHADAVRQIADITTEAEGVDGTSPLDEAMWLALRHRADEVSAWVEADGFALVVEDELALAVRPSARGHGTGARLLDQALAELPGDLGPLRAWSHADHPAAARLAKGRGFEKVRELWVMRRASSLPVGEVAVADDVVVRRFRPGDEAELLRVNGAAFAGHPEQGKMTADDLAERMAEPWFDPEGMIVAGRGRELLGFHWTKRHSPELGEVYVVGVDPAAQGTGLGRALTRAGLKHLADRGTHEVLLYVDADNERAVQLYARDGFTHSAQDTHVMYRRT